MIKQVLSMPVEHVMPPVSAVLEGQGIPSWVEPDERTMQLVHDALDLYREKACPKGLLTEITGEEFGKVLHGEGISVEESPVNAISRMSDDLALFAVTVGDKVSREISDLFGRSDFALASMLDAAASEGAEMTAQAVEDVYRRDLKERGRLDGRKGTLRFSPGYCGWHVAGQRMLFPALQPGEIGISLNESCLMNPLKSISGVIIAGRKEIFEFEDVFSFCRDCATHTCRERIKALLDE